MNGKIRSVWMPDDLDNKVEIARKKYGLNRSSFLRYAIVEAMRRFDNSRKEAE